MRNSVRLLALTSILMSLCCHASAQPTINTHVVDTTFVPDSVYQNMKNTFFNAAKFDGNDIKTAEDLVRKMPGAEMKDDGSIMINGKSIIKILVNGKQYFPEHEYVDLGLSVKWATCNVGAAYPEKAGGFFAWGETEPITERNINNYKFCKGNHRSFTKYCTDDKLGDQGFTDNKITLDLEDDVANVMWGGDWRIPTADECQELIENCTCTMDSINGVKGFRVTSNVPGYTDRSIFFPAAGGDGILVSIGQVHWIMTDQM